MDGDAISCIRINYVLGLGFLVISVIITLAELSRLASQEESPENSREIRKLLSLKWVISMLGLLTLGAGGFLVAAFIYKIVAAITSITVKAVREMPNQLALLLEAKRRYGKAKRGHGIKPEPEEEEEPWGLVRDQVIREVRAQTASHSGTLPD